jgi:serine/threonine-protein kinase
VRGANQVDERGDIYAFGVILYEMLTGQRPFEAETYNQLILKIATEDPAPILELNPCIDRRLALVIERAMAREPKDRFSTIEELAVALEPFSNGVLFRASTVRVQTPAATSGEHASVSYSIRPGHRRSRAAMILGIALGGIGAGLGFWALAHQRAHPEDREPATLAIPSLQPKPLEAVPVSQETVVSASTQPAAPPELANPVGAVVAGPDAKDSAHEPKLSGSEAKLGERGPGSAARDKRIRARPRSTEPKQLAPAASSRSNGKLPDDWDERLSIPTKLPANTTNPAGPIDARDLR